MGVRAAWKALWSREGRGEAKASATGPVIVATGAPGQPRYTPVRYDRLAADYACGRALPAEALEAWRAARAHPHPAVRWVAGRAERLPLAGGACAWALMSTVVHPWTTSSPPAWPRSTRRPRPRPPRRRWWTASTCWCCAADAPGG